MGVIVAADKKLFTIPSGSTEPLIISTSNACDISIIAIGADADGDANVFAVTLTANAKVGDLTIIPEIRLDSASEEVFLNNDLELNESLGSFLLAAVYSF